MVTIRSRPITVGMKSYDIFTILSPRMSEEEVSSFTKNIEGIIEKDGAKSESSEIKLNQRLSYPIKHQRTGHMVKIKAEAENAIDLAGTLDEELKTNENVIRKMVISHPKEDVKEKGPVSVIDQLRHQQREDRATVQKGSGAEDQSTADQPEAGKPTEDKQADTAEIDKRLEELLK